MRIELEKPHVVFDLDGTLVFPQRHDIAVPGRTRSNYLSRQLASLLYRLSVQCHVSIASARSLYSVQGLLDQLPEVPFYGLVCECGFDVRSAASCSKALNERTDRDTERRTQQRIRLVKEIRTRFPDWEIIAGYHSIVGCVSGIAAEDAHSNAVELISRNDLEGCDLDGWIVHQERHKTFFYPGHPDKLAGLRSLGILQITAAAGDDATYDAGMLDAAEIPATLCTADPEIVRFVQQRDGILSDIGGHAGAIQMVRQLIDRVGA